MVSLTDGMYLSHGLTEMLAIQFLEDADFSVLLRGHGGELAKASLAWPLHTDERIHRMRSKEESVPYLLQRVNYISRGVALHELFTEEWYAQMEGAAHILSRKVLLTCTCLRQTSVAICISRSTIDGLRLLLWNYSARCSR